MDLIIDRDHDGYGRVFHMVKMQFSVLQVSGTDLKIAANPVPSVLCEIQLSVFSRVEDGVLEVTRDLSLSRALRHNFIHSTVAFPESFPHDRLMLRQVCKVSCHSRVLASEAGDDGIQIRHMVVCEALDLLLLADRDIFFRDLLF